MSKQRKVWKHPWYFALAICFWERGLALSYGNNMQWYSIGEDWFSICLQVSVAGSVLIGVEVHVYFPLSVPGTQLDWTCTGLMCTASVCEFICAEVMWCMEDPVSLELTISASLCPSDSLYTKISEPSRDDDDVSFMTECSNISHSQYIVHTWFSVLGPI